MSARTVVTPKRPPARFSLTWLVLALAVVIAVGERCAGATDAPPLRPLDQATGKLLSDYLANPRANRAAVLALGQHGADTLPVQAQLAIADAYLRSGATTRAAQVLSGITARGDAGPWTGWAEYGLGWVALAGGNTDEALAHFGRAKAAGWNSAAVATLVGLIDASEGNGLQAAQGLAEVGAEAAMTTPLLEVTRLGIAYAYYWSGEWTAARTRFGLFAREFPKSPLADDAAYGAAWSAYRAGQRDDAVDELRTIAAGEISARRGGTISEMQVNLAVREVLGNGLRRFRRGRHTMQSVDGQLVDILDLDGVALARAALRRLGEGEVRPSSESVESLQRAATTQASDAAVVDERGAARGTEAEGPRVAAQPNESGGRAEPGNEARPRRFPLVFLVVIVAVALAWLWRRPQAATNLGTPRAGRSASKQALRRS